MKRIVKLGSVVVAVVAVWLSVMLDLVPPGLLSKHQTELLQIMPLYLLVSFGCYSLAVIGYRVATFRDCPEESKSLTVEINLRDLIEAKDEICINGPCHTALLYARCASVDDVVELSVSLKQGAKYPQVKVGPVRSNADSKIRSRLGLMYADFGEIVATPLKGDETARCLKYEGTPVMYFVRMGQMFTAVKPDGARLGETLYMKDDELGPSLQILCEPNEDMLLVLVGLLTTFLASAKMCDDVLQSTSG